jgi:hypothetical protein
MATKQEKMKIVQALEKRLRKQLPDMEIIVGKGIGTDVRVYVLSKKWRTVRTDPYYLIVKALHDELKGDSALSKILVCWPFTPKEYEEFKGTPYYVERNGKMTAEQSNAASAILT